MFIRQSRGQASEGRVSRGKAVVSGCGLTSGTCGSGPVRSPPPAEAGEVLFQSDDGWQDQSDQTIEQNISWEILSQHSHTPLGWLRITPTLVSVDSFH